MAVSQGWEVRFHYESGSYGGKKRSDLGERRVVVIAAANDAATLTSVLNADGYAAPAGTVLVIDSVGSSSPAQFLT
jgi:hypothetical protein